MPSFFSGAPNDTPTSDFSTTKGADALGAGFRIGDDEDRVEVRDPGVGDPALHAVEDEMITVSYGPSPHARRIRAGLGLRTGSRRPSPRREQWAADRLSLISSEPTSSHGRLASLLTAGIRDVAAQTPSNLLG